MWRHTRSDDDFAEEIRGHIAAETDRLIAEGLSPEEARAAAHRAFGSTTLARERFFESQRPVWLDGLVRDLREAVRGLVRMRGFALIAIATMALGTGVTTAMFSVVNAVLIRPLPYPRPDRLVSLRFNQPAAESPTGQPRSIGVSLSANELAELRRRARSVTHAGASSLSFVVMTSGSEAARLEGARVSPDVFQMRGVRPLFGRTFGEEDDAPGAAPAMILSERAWRRHFNADPGIIGRVAVLDDVFARMRPAAGGGAGVPHAIVGVMPDGFEAGSQTQFWVPLVRSSGAEPGPRGGVTFRLADGVSLEAAAQEVGVVVDEILGRRSKTPPAAGAPPRYSFEVDGARVGDMKPALQVLMAAAAVVLLIACVNVGNLVMARTSERQREISIRVALGAGRGRVIRLLLTETLLIATAGAAGGIALAVGGVRLLRTLAETIGRMDLGVQLPFPRLGEVGVDPAALGFAIVAAMAAGLACGLAPALGQSRDVRPDLLRDSTGTAYGGFALTGRHRLRGVFIAAQVALAMMLLVGGGLLIRTFAALSTVDLGYEPANVITFQIALPSDPYSGERLRTFAEEFVGRMRTVPGVRAAAYGRQVPFIAIRESAWFRRTPDLPTPPPPQPSGAPDARLVSREYLSAIGMRLVAGRGFEERDGPGAGRVMVINESLARQAFPSQNPVGQFVYAGRGRRPWEIVGVVADVRQFAQDEEAQPQFFVDYRQWSSSDGVFFTFLGPYYAVRADGDPAAVMAHARSVARALDPQAGVFSVASLDQLRANRISRPRLYAVLLGLFAALAVVLAAVGIYGVMAYSVAKRTREIGVRIALGAQPPAVVGLVVRQSAMLTLAGIVLGLAGAAAGTRYLEGLLFGLTPLDPATFAGMSALFLGVAMVASYIPARRAATIDPTTALRQP